MCHGSAIQIQETSIGNTEKDSDHLPDHGLLPDTELEHE